MIKVSELSDDNRSIWRGLQKKVPDCHFFTFLVLYPYVALPKVLVLLLGKYIWVGSWRRELKIQQTRQIFFPNFSISACTLWEARSPSSLDGFRSYLDSGQILLGENDFWSHHRPDPLLPGRGGGGRPLGNPKMSTQSEIFKIEM
jgi:hypothetical protein